MNHQIYRKNMQLLLYGELEGSEKQTLEEHLRTCEECRVELEAMRRFFDVLPPDSGPEGTTEEMLRDARLKLRDAIRHERQRPTWTDWVRDFAAPFMASGYRIALGGGVVLIGGILIGRLTAGRQGEPGSTNPQVAAASTTAPERSPGITNVRFINSDRATGDIEFTFDAVAPMHMKGSVDDPAIQRVLMHALLNEENPGTRIRAVSVIGEQKAEPADREIKAALILALKGDVNAAVRKEAIKALRKFPFDDETKSALLHTLMTDTNPGLRIAAINGLDSAGVTIQRGEDVLNVLKNRADSDDNNYIRLRAKAVLQEVRNQ